MGQDWIIVNLDKGELYNAYWGKLGEWIFDGSPGRLVPALQKAVDHEFFLRPASESKTDNVISLRMTSSRACDLGHLPREMIDLIFGHLDEDVDVICFGLTCRFLWEFCRPIMQTRTREFANECSWAGDRIICVGDYIQAGDEPKGVLTEEELEELEDSPRTTLFSKTYTSNAVFDFDKWFRYPIIIEKHLTSEDRSIFNSLTSDSYAYQTASRLEQPVALRCLRNLSRHEYVRGQAVDEFNKKTSSNDVNLGTVMVLHICWSSDSSTSMCYDGDIHRGKWAGERFDITTVDSVKDANVWKDVSVEVMETVEAIWRSEFDRKGR